MSALVAGEQHFRHPPSRSFVKVLEQSECAM
jgi:hypothetical protein